ncbi:MAG: isoprenyl transferase [candidate division Zixibacteria bacterium]|nr:isoprenyl transferase [candidate division Zixibacteria bacterium]
MPHSDATGCGAFLFPQGGLAHLFSAAGPEKLPCRNHRRVVEWIVNQSAEQQAIAEIKAGGKCPAHVAIIMDGNGRWAAKRGLPRKDGHAAGVKTVRTVVEIASEVGVKFLTLYTFSVENWNRPRDEVASLMDLLAKTTMRELDDLMRNNVRLITTGRIRELPLIERKVLQSAVKKTAGNTGLTLNLALNYGGRTEIVDAVRAIARDLRDEKITSRQITEHMFAEYLYTAGLPDPDLLIRTSGEMRLSNFLIWQTSYTEIYITNTLWPDFGRADFLAALQDYIKRDRRFGRVGST